MFVETRTTPAEVITDAWREVEHLLNATLSGCRTRRLHPTYTTKTAIRNELVGAQAAYRLVRRLGDGTVPAHIDAKHAEAVAAVGAL